MLMVFMLASIAAMVMSAGEECTEDVPPKSGSSSPRAGGSAMAASAAIMPSTISLYSSGLQSASSPVVSTGRAMAKSSPPS